MIVTWTSLTILVMVLASISLAIGSVFGRTARGLGPGLAPGAREFPSFLAGSRAPKLSMLGTCHVPLASIEPPPRSKRRSRPGSRPAFSRSPGHDAFCLPAFNDSSHSRRFWASMTSE